MAEPYPLSEKAEGASPACCLLPGTSLREVMSLEPRPRSPSSSGGGEGNMCYRARYKPTRLQTSGTDLRSSENVSVTLAALGVRGFSSQGPPEGKGTWRVLILSIPACHPACLLYHRVGFFFFFLTSSQSTFICFLRVYGTLTMVQMLQSMVGME